MTPNRRWRQETQALISKHPVSNLRPIHSQGAFFERLQNEQQTLRRQPDLLGS